MYLRIDKEWNFKSHLTCDINLHINLITKADAHIGNNTVWISYVLMFALRSVVETETFFVEFTNKITNIRSATSVHVGPRGTDGQNSETFDNVYSFFY
jgi:hypothetical protein